MFQFKNYVSAKSLEEAYELNQKKSNVVLGGTGWLKMADKQYQTAIDLSMLGLDTIEETEDEFQIGCMTTLRTMECHKELNEYTNNAVKECVRHIVGVQFRNCATVGGSIWGRFGFSDILTCFLALDCYVELFQAGRIPLSEFVKMSYDNDLLIRIIIKKTPFTVTYQSFRNQSTDFPVLTCAFSANNQNEETKYKLSIGARPAKAAVISDERNILHDFAQLDEEEKTAAIERFSEWAAEQFAYESNLRASAEYRKMLAKVLTKRCILQN